MLARTDFASLAVAIGTVARSLSAAFFVAPTAFAAAFGARAAATRAFALGFASVAVGAVARSLDGTPAGFFVAPAAFAFCFGAFVRVTAFAALGGFARFCLPETRERDAFAPRLVCFVFFGEAFVMPR